MTIITRIELVNFKSHKDTTVNFRKGRVVILGENGAGKSTIEQGISYAFFATVDGFPLDDLVGTGGTMFKVNLEFEVLGKKYRVERENGVGKGKKIVGRLFSIKPGGTGRVVLAEGQENVSEEVLRILGTGDSSADLRKYIVVPQNQIQAIISQEPKARRDFFDALFGISDYEDTRRRLYSMLGFLETMLEGYDREISSRKGDVELLPKKKNALKDLKKEIEETRKIFDESSLLYGKKNGEYVTLGNIAAKIASIKQDITRINQEIQNQVKQVQGKYQALVTADPKRVPAAPEITRDLLEKLRDTLTREAKDLDAAVEQKNKEIEILKGLQTKLGDKQSQHSKLIGQIDKYAAEIFQLDEGLKRDGGRLLLNELPMDEWGSELSLRVNDFEKRIKMLKQLKTAASPFIAALTEAITSRSHLEGNIHKDKARVEINSKALDKKYLKGVPLEEYWTQLKKSAGEEMLTSLNQEQEKLSGEKSSTEGTIAALKNERQSTEAMQDELQKIAVGGICTCCHQPVSEEHKQEELGRLRTKIEDLDKNITGELKNLTAVREQLKDVEKRLKTTRANGTLLVQFQGDVKQLKENQDDLSSDQADLKKVTTRVTSQLQKLQDVITPHTFIKLGDAGEKVVPSIDAELDRVTIARDECNGIIGAITKFSEKTAELKGLQEESNALLKEIGGIKSSFSVTALKTAEEGRAALVSDQRAVSNLKSKMEACITTSIHVEEQQVDLQKRRAELVVLEPQFDQKVYSALETEVRELNDRKVANQAKLETLVTKSLPDMESSVRLLEQSKAIFDDASRQHNVHTIARRELENYERFFQDIQVHIRRRFVQQTSREATNLLRQMVEMPEFSEIRISEDYNLEVFRYNKFESLSRLSGGEKMVMSLAIRIAIASRLGKQDLILLDEPTESLDTERIHSIVECFERFSPLSQIFIITHDPEFERIADQVIRVSKDTGHSVVEGARE